MKNPFTTIDKWSTWRNLVLMIVISAVSVIMMGFLTQTLVYDVYGEASMPDTQFTYTYDEILEAFNILGAQGLQIWSQVHLLDTIFPIGYSFALVFGLGLGLRATYPEKETLRVLTLFPLIAALFDYLENALIASQIGVYPNLSIEVIAISSVVTSIKWILLYSTFAVVFILMIIWIIQKIAIQLK
ncbi:MAG: hypothetical protein GF411_11585 [Candidatus Lokiarchaeota archaeon]|nr:hypothetical protein [Candidatus Lokiarchaeota archaeon]